MPKGNYDHAGKTCSKEEMMKAWDGPKEQGRWQRAKPARPDA